MCGVRHTSHVPTTRIPPHQIEAEFAKFEDPAEPGCMNGDQVLAFAEKLGVDPFRCGYRMNADSCGVAVVAA